jgi:SAM-dependent methyltransferase
MKSVEQSYAAQSRNEFLMGLPTRYTDPRSIDNWRHTRMLATVKPILDVDKRATWLTIGDGRFGSDAAYLHSQGASVTATSLTDDSLREAFALGHIPAFRAENAEHISSPDESVDYVLCKEAYHHFPRPPIALYEMLRISRKAAILIEPLDNPKILDGVKRLIKLLIRGDTQVEFEPSGNYLYRLDIRETRKLMTAMGASTMAYKRLNDFFHPKLSKYPADKLNVGSLLTKLGIAVQNLACSLGLLGYGMVVIVLFRGEASHSETLRNAGFTITTLPINPFATSTSEVVVD